MDNYVDPSGVTVTFSYDESGRVSSVTNGLNRTISLTYTDDQLTSVSDGTGRSVSYVVDTSGNLTAFTDAEDNTTTYDYLSPSLLANIYLPANPTESVFTNSYDSLARVMSQSRSNAGTWNYFFAGSRSEVVDPAGNSHVWYLDQIGCLVSEINELNQQTQYERDGMFRLKKTILPEQNAIELTYDNNNNVLTVTWVAKPGSGLTNIVNQFTYDSQWAKVASFTDGVGNVTNFTYDETQGTLLTIVRPEIGGSNPTVNFTYNERGQLLTSTDETGIVDSFAYSESDETLLSITHDSGTGRLNIELALGYDSVGNINSLTDPNSNTTTFLYDNQRRMTKRTDPYVFQTDWEFNENGWLIVLQRQTGDPTNPYQTWNWAYLVNGLVATITDPASNATTFGYDPDFARLISQTDAEDREYQFSYDALSRIQTVTDPMSVVSQTRTYTDNGLLSSIADAASNLTTYQYDGFDRLQKLIYPNATFEEYSYNLNNQIVTALTRLGDTITNTYDVLTRLSTRQPGPVLGLQTFNYDLAGRLLEVSTPTVSGNPASGPYSFSYDTAGRLIQQTMPNGDTVGYQLDANGNRTQLIWPDTDGYYAQYQYDQLNRLTNILLNGSTSPSVSFEYDALSRRTQMSYENGSVTAYSYAINNDLTTHTINFVGSSVEFGLTYDNVHELTGMSASDGSFLWIPAAASTSSYATANDLNQYPSVDGTDYTYDANGSLTAGQQSATFDALNRVTQIVSGSTTNNYSVDPLNRQARKSVNGSNTDYLYNGQQLIATYDDSGDLLQRFIPGLGLDERFINIQRGTSTYLHTDRIGSVIAETDSSGAVLNKFAFSPFGESSAVSSSNFGFTGQRYDSEIGLYNYKMRYYSPSIGRFLQPDPIGFAGGDLNLYAYCSNNPLNFFDPDGLSFKVVDGDPAVFNQTLAQLRAQNGTMSDVLDFLASDKSPEIKVHLNSNFDTYSNFRDGPQLYWDPTAALRFQNSNGNSGFLSPACALGHELGHQYDFFQKYGGNPDAFYAAERSPAIFSPLMKNRIEESAISNYENPLSSSLGGQVFRDNYGSTPNGGNPGVIVPLDAPNYYYRVRAPFSR